MSSRTNRATEKDLVSKNNFSPDERVAFDLSYYGMYLVKVKDESNAALPLWIP